MSKLWNVRTLKSDQLTIYFNGLNMPYYKIRHISPLRLPKNDNVEVLYQKFYDMPLRTYVYLKPRKSLKDVLKQKDGVEARRIPLKHLKAETKGLMKVLTVP